MIQYAGIYQISDIRDYTKVSASVCRWCEGGVRAESWTDTTPPCVKLTQRHCANARDLCRFIMLFLFVC